VAGFVGRGGSAEVYCARHRRLGTAAVLKVLCRGGEGPCERFDRETRFLMESPGPSFPAFFGAGVEDGRPWIAMELLEDCPLPSTDKAVAAYLLDVARGVAELHRRDWIHRDLKPRNILRRADGHAVLVDFGLLKRAGEDAAKETAAGRLSPSVVEGREVGVGTPGYAAPEQFAGGAATPATDVHALGILADECFGGHPPRAWERIIRRATASLPRQRYADAGAFARAVRRRHWRRNVLLAALVCVSVGLLLPLALPPPEDAERAPAETPSRIEILPGAALMLERTPSGGVALRLGGSGGKEDAEAASSRPERKAAAAESAPKPFHNTIAGMLDDLVPVPGQADRIARHEVTQAQWQELMGDNPSQSKGDELPVDSVTLLASVRFLDRLNALPAVKARGIWFRLPFADEWKKAAGRPGTIEHRGNVREQTQSRCYDVDDGYYCMSLDADGHVLETVASPLADWKPGPGGYVRTDDALPMGLRVCADASPRLPGR
jgi:serine/threonine protein kinase